MADYTGNVPLNPTSNVQYNTRRLSYTVESPDLLDGDTFIQNVSDLPPDISVAVFPGASATMTVQYTVSEKYDDQYFDWPSGSVTSNTADVVIGKVYSIKITTTGGPGRFFIGT